MLPVFVADKVSMEKRRTPERAEGGSGRQRFPSRPAKEEFLNGIHQRLDGWSESWVWSGVFKKLARSSNI